MNIGQIKSRGATVIVITNVPDIGKQVPIDQIDFLIEIFP
jgi:hypothetical protein